MKKTNEVFELSDAFRTLSATLGQDPLQVQGPGGNTSMKKDGVMWIKASGTELANAEEQNIFVAVDRDAAVSQAKGKTGDGSCKTTVIDSNSTLRPSIETTFHALLEYSVVVHTHSIATIAHAISPNGRALLSDKLDGLEYAVVPYAKPGLPLTREIQKRAKPETRVFILQNHGLICCGDTVEQAAELIKDVEKRLQLKPRSNSANQPNENPPNQMKWSDQNWIAQDPIARERALAGTYYPDHVVFLGPALPQRNHQQNPPAILHKDLGILIREDATESQLAMLKCLSDVLIRVPDDWTLEPIGSSAEAELLDWDAEKYRQALAARS